MFKKYYFSMYCVDLMLGNFYYILINLCRFVSFKYLDILKILFKYVDLYVWNFFYILSFLWWKSMDEG